MTALGILTWLVDLGLRASVPLALAVIGISLSRSRSAAERHGIAAGTLIFVLALIVLALAFPAAVRWLPGDWAGDPSGSAISAQTFYTALAIGKARDLAPTEPAASAAVVAVVAIWLLGASLLLSWRAVCWWCAFALPGRLAPWSGSRARRQIDEALAAANLSRRQRVLLSDRVRVPMAWGPPRPYVLLPMEATRWSEDRLRSALVHELSHIRRRDSLTQGAAGLVQAVLWFHPLVWVLSRRMSLEQECACDDLVLASGVPAPRYARHLVALADRSGAPLGAWSGLPGSAGGRSLVRRVREICRSTAPRDRLGGRFLTLLVSAAAALIAAFLAGSLAAQSGAELSAESASEVVDLIAGDMEEMEIPGAALTVVKDGEVVLLHGAGLASIDERRAVDVEETVFRLGSITKVLTSIALLQNLEREGIPLDDPVEPHAKGLLVPSSSGEPVTFRHLLTHTAGFDQLGYGRRAPSATDVLPLRTFLERNLVPQRAPGSISTYDTYGMTLAGYLVEALSGRTFQDYVTEEIFRPLGMTRSGFQGPDATTAVGYAGRGIETKAQAWEYHHTVPASSANSTAGDMARFLVALLEDCRSGEVELLPPSTCRDMLRQQYSNHPRLPGYGLGWLTERQNGVDVVHHGGSMDGFSALVFLIPSEKVGLFVAGNREDGRFTEGARHWLMRSFFDTGEEGAQPPEPVSGVDVEKFAGPWITTLRCHVCDGRQDFYWRGGPFDIKVADGGLILGGRKAVPIAPLLFQREDGLLIAFRETGEGGVTRMAIRHSVFERPPAVPKPAPPTIETYVHPVCPIDCGDELHQERSSARKTCPICGMEYVPQRH